MDVLIRFEQYGRVTEARQTWEKDPGHDKIRELFEDTLRGAGYVIDYDLPRDTDNRPFTPYVHNPNKTLSWGWPDGVTATTRVTLIHRSGLVVSGEAAEFGWRTDGGHNDILFYRIED